MMGGCCVAPDGRAEVAGTENKEITAETTVMTLSFWTDIWNSADQDQTAPRGAVWSGSSLFAIPFASFGQIILWFGLFVWVLGSLQQSFLASENLGTLQYVSHTTCFLHMSLVGKPDFHTCENKGADQLPSNCAADQRLCFRYIGKF